VGVTQDGEVGEDSEDTDAEGEERKTYIGEPYSAPFGAAGSTRGGKFGLGERTDQLLSFSGNENVLLVFGVGALVIMVVLLLIGPPPQSGLSYYNY